MNKPILDRCNKLIDDGFSLIPVREDKVPMIKWTELNEKALTQDKFKQHYEKAEGIGIVTGFDYLEVIDVDLKVFSTAQEKKQTWDELLALWRENIFDFDDKFVVYKTKNEGFHIIYKSKRIKGNTKIAKAQGHKEALIESRGAKGYIFIYDGQSINKKTYSDVQFISDEDHKALWQCCLFFHHIEEVKEIKPKTKQNKKTEGLSSWDDYNEKTSIFDIIGSEFKIVKDIKDRYIIKRHGAKSAHSGYVYHNTGCMYLFTTGTVYPAEQLISPFAAYTFRNHNGDFSDSAKELYKQGFGDRQKPVEIATKEETALEIPKDISFPLEVFPDEYRNYILELHRIYGFSIDYLACTLLWVISVILGNSLKVEIKRGWSESSILWLCLVGQRGIGKTPSVNFMSKVLRDANNKELENYNKELAKYEEYQLLDQKEKKLTQKKQNPNSRQFIVDDITMEALMDLHSYNKNGIAVFKDELAGWFKDMNKYRAGSDVQSWLSSWNNDSIYLNRKTSKSSFIKRSFMPVLGGIQPEIFSSFYNEENESNGFMDRVLFSYPELKVDKFVREDIGDEYLKWYNDSISWFFDHVKNDVIDYDNDRDIVPKIAKFDDSAFDEYERIFNKITDMQNDDNESEFVKSALSKQKTYIGRFSLILNSLNASVGESDLMVIDKDSILGAEKLSEYFVQMAKKVKFEILENVSASKIIKNNEGKNTAQKIKLLLEANPKLSTTKLAKTLGVSRTTIHKYLNKKN